MILVIMIWITILEHQHYIFVFFYLSNKFDNTMYYVVGICFKLLICIQQVWIKIKNKYTNFIVSCGVVNSTPCLYSYCVKHVISKLNFEWKCDFYGYWRVYSPKQLFVISRKCVTAICKLCVSGYPKVSARVDLPGAFFRFCHLYYNLFYKIKFRVLYLFRKTFDYLIVVILFTIFKYLYE